MAHGKPEAAVYLWGAATARCNTNGLNARGLTNSLWLCPSCTGTAQSMALAMAGQHPVHPAQQALGFSHPFHRP